MGFIDSFKARFGRDGSNQYANMETTQELDKVVKNPKGLPDDDISTGLNMYAGTEVKWNDHPSKYRNQSQRIKAYREMTQDPSVSGSLRQYTQLCRLADWTSESAKPTKFEEEGEKKVAVDWDEKEAERYRLFLEQNICDMDGSMEDLVSAAMQFLVMGYAIVVPVFKFRRGNSKNHKENSKFDDGLIGWQGFKQIDPWSVKYWDTPQGSGYLECKGFYQQTISGYETYVSRERYLHFRTTAKDNSPSGESVLVGSIQPWEEKCRISEIEKIGLERDLSGIPVLRCPSEYLTEEAPQAHKNVVAYLRKLGSSLKFNSQTYLLLPSNTDDNGNRYVDAELLQAGPNTKLAEARQIIEAKERLIMENLNSQFLKLGSSSGSFALSDDMSSMFVLCLRAYLDVIASTMNREAVQKLFELNKTEFPDSKYIPRLTYSGLEKNDVDVAINALATAVEKGVVIPTAEIQEEVLDRLDMPGHEAKVAFKKQEKLQEELIKQSLKQGEEGQGNSPTPKSGGNAVSKVTGG